MASKVKSSKAPAWAKGGSTKMFGRQAAGPQKPGTTAHNVSGNGGKFAKGGRGHMFGRQTANPRVPGKTGK